MGRTFDVIAIYDFTSPQPGDLGMAKVSSDVTPIWHSECVVMTSFGSVAFVVRVEL